MINCNTENEENNLQNSIYKYDEPSESIIPIITPFRRINSIGENVTTINDEDNFNAFNNNLFDYNNIINLNDFEKNNYYFNYNNSINERNNNDNLINSLSNVLNEDSNKITGNNNNEKIEKSELKINSFEIKIQDYNQANSIQNTLYKKMEEEKNLFKTKRKRGKRKSKIGKKQEKPRLFNDKSKFRNIVIDSIFNHIKTKLKRFNLEFWMLDFKEIKGKKYEELKDKKLREIFSIASRKNNNDLDLNKKIIAEIDKLEDSELNIILELKLFDVYYHILIEETNVLKGLRQEYGSLKQKEILENPAKTILDIKSYEKDETFYKNQLIYQ